MFVIFHNKPILKVIVIQLTADGVGMSGIWWDSSAKSGLQLTSSTFHWLYIVLELRKGRIALFLTCIHKGKCMGGGGGQNCVPITLCVWSGGSFQISAVLHTYCSLNSSNTLLHCVLASLNLYVFSYAVRINS